MKRLAVVLIVLGLAAGCNMQPVKEAKQDAYKRWYETRAQLLYGLAEDQYKAGELLKARSTANEVLGLDSQHRQGRLLLAKINIEEGEYPAAVDLLSRLESENPKSAEVLYLLGVAQENRGLFQDALVSYRRAQELDPSDLAPIIAATEVLAAQGDLKQAQAYVESYISLAGNNARMYELAGRLAMMLNDPGKAAGYYQQACDLNSANRQSAEMLGEALFMDRQYERAAQALAPLTAAPDYSAPAWVHTMLGDCYMAMDRARQAREAYAQATELSPSDPGAWCNLAKAALAAEDMPRAIVAARQALRLDGNCQDASVLLGYAMLRDGDVDRARAVLADAAGRHPASAELRCVLGRVHAAAGDGESARRCYAEALRIEPGNVLAAQLLAAADSGGQEPSIN